MAALHMVREHGLGLDAARRIAADWARKVESELGMKCVAENCDGQECIRFERSGVSGTLLVTAGKFELDAKLGFLLGAFKQRIETEITRHLDQMLASGPSPKSPQPGKKNRAV